MAYQAASLCNQDLMDLMNVTGWQGKLQTNDIVCTNSLYSKGGIMLITTEVNGHRKTWVPVLIYSLRCLERVSSSYII